MLCLFVLNVLCVGILGECECECMCFVIVHVCIRLCICVCLYVVYVCTYMCVFVYNYVYMYCACIYICVYVCMVCLDLHVNICVSMNFSCSDSDLIVQSELDNRDKELCLESTDTPGDSKTDARDDSEIQTGSCSTEQTMIQAQNHVISCECLHYLFILFVPFIVLFHVDV